MGKGLLSGLFWGTSVSALVLGTTSLVAPPPVTSVAVAPGAGGDATPAEPPGAEAGRPEAERADEVAAPEEGPRVGAEAGSPPPAAAPESEPETAASQSDQPAEVAPAASDAPDGPRVAETERDPAQTGIGTPADSAVAAAGPDVAEGVGASDQTAPADPGQAAESPTEAADVPLEAPAGVPDQTPSAAAPAAVADISEAGGPAASEAEPDASATDAPSPDATVAEDSTSDQPVAVETAATEPAIGQSAPGEPATGQLVADRASAAPTGRDRDEEVPDAMVALPELGFPVPSARTRESQEVETDDQRAPSDASPLARAIEDGFAGEARRAPAASVFAEIAGTQDAGAAAPGVAERLSTGVVGLSSARSDTGEPTIPSALVAAAIGPAPATGPAALAPQDAGRAEPGRAVVAAADGEAIAIELEPSATGEGAESGAPAVALAEPEVAEGTELGAGLAPSATEGPVAAAVTEAEPEILAESVGTPETGAAAGSEAPPDADTGAQVGANDAVVVVEDAAPEAEPETGSQGAQVTAEAPPADTAPLEQAASDETTADPAAEVAEAVTEVSPPAAGSDPEASEPEDRVAAAPAAPEQGSPDVAAAETTEPEPAEPEEPPSEVATLEPAAPPQPGLGGGLSTRVQPLTERASGTLGGVRIRRIQPADGASDLPGEPAPGAPEPATPEPADGGAPDGPALERNARPFDNPDGLPVLAIVLLAEEAELPGQGLDGLDAPLSIAVRPDAPDVGTLMSDYREAGQEVLIHGAGLPRNPLPQDVEVTLGTRLSQLDQVVALLDLEEGGISRDREVLEQALGVLSDGGHGLLLWDQGLNSAFGIASRIGHPAALVPRKVAGTDGRAVARALDRAAFDAGRSGSGGILAIEATGPALEALRSWLETSRAEQVALAPVSALLRPSEP